jgi:hypothetical protein
MVVQKIVWIRWITMLWEHVVWGVLEFEPSQLSVNKKSFDIEIDNLIVYLQKNAFQKRGLKLIWMKRIKMQCWIFLKLNRRRRSPKAIIAYNEKTDR